MSAGKNGKGSGRRIRTVPADDAAENWEHCLGKKIMPWEANDDAEEVTNVSNE